MKTLRISSAVLIALAVLATAAMVLASPAGLYETSKAAASAPTMPAPAVTAPAPSQDFTNAVSAAVIGIVPILVWGIKKVLPVSLHNYFPLVATVLGPVVAFLASKAVDHSITPTAAVALGMAAVGLRELIAHLTRAVAEKL